MMNNLQLSDTAFQLDGKMPLRQAIPLGLQHVLAMFVGNLTPLLIITGACGIAGGEFASLQLSRYRKAMNLVLFPPVMPPMPQPVYAPPQPEPAPQEEGQPPQA